MSSSELAGFLPRPAFNHDLRLGVKLHRVSALRVQDAKEAFLPTAEGKIRHGSGYADVDADVPGGRLIAEFARRRAVGRKQRSLVAIRALANEFDGVVNRIRMNQAQYRTENLRIPKRTRGRHTVEHRRLQEISMLVAGCHFGAATIYNSLRAVGHALRN